MKPHRIALTTLVCAQAPGPHASRATHVSDPAIVVASARSLRYTLAGFPPGNLRTGSGAPCG